ncbi:transglycosylase SLT domain-containing protein [Dyella sp.]|jgi:soluble lytic murein transglycosylase|uniref:transglycosylase SLT domain-containing protein n=1 Tax=Dyella sp. TaxID=1869338 RepID=UPI002D7790CD|nr:transglycosylase SLT domain-containing protein [Dyella sp.]HET6431924.1 transglycosylase SLT domain-containing protein [Dyella sp.]
MPAFAPLPHRTDRSFLRLACAFALLLVAPGIVRAAAGTEAQRAAFTTAYASAQRGDAAWKAQAKGLESYVLYPYLPAAALEHDLATLDTAAVSDYLARYPGQIPANDLRRAFLGELARRQDWNDFLALYQDGLGDALACDALQARMARGETLDFQRDLDALWHRPSLPGACDPVLAQARAQGLLTTDRLWARIDRALYAGAGGTVAALAGWLPDEQAAAGARLAQALRDPAAAVADADHWPDTPRHRQAAALALQRLARRQSGAADAAWLTLRHRFSFSDAQRNDVLNALALFHATDFDDNALQRLSQLPPDAQSDATREWRVRVALAAQNWPAVLKAIDALSPAQQADGEWQYFRARALAELGKPAQAQPLFAALAQQPTYFGFLAADRADAPYTLCPLSLDDDAARAQSLLANIGLQRAFELYAVGMPREARREWAQALRGTDPATQREAALLAYQRGWYDRAVFTFSSGDMLRLYEQRFPLASQDGVVPQAEQAGIDPAWAYAIARAESAWMSDAHSGADARGLMQLLPATAAQVARSYQLPWNGGDSLYDPAVNVALGTRYLAQMAARFNGAPWLASAAYNAGPIKVDQWLAERGTLPPDVFTATIPYKETREYVARVMAFSVIYDWRMSGRAVPLDARMPPIGATYAPPAPGAARKAISCPATAAASAERVPASSVSTSS